ncbi:putative glycosyl transferase [Dissulfuribacter thermophilus]|uniref:Putative glycosyl transferase n=1 Tax=Dissulfuribacter thermophilus TaxID=1156395 RepID=A0A1B9F3Z9_9BACT|nr:glycosyltransferase [Dissulfuribacter thermophilus]OCC14658.1 putative glycosyl transferase [Dissulfuribacter thermophilus]
MESFLVVIYWIIASLIVYTWFIFPLGLFCLSKIVRFFQPRNYIMRETCHNSVLELPSVSVIVAAYNEEKVIARRIENLLEQNYPSGKIEIIIASDGSSDKTVEIAQRYKKKGIKLLAFKENRGKASVHNDSVEVVKGEILLFTDAETIFEKDFIKNGIKWFKSNRYGCGAGEFTFYYKDEIGRSENIYWIIEKKMRYWESCLGILPFASGGCFFIRHELYEKIPSHSDIDNILTLSTVAKGYKIFYAQDAKAYDFAIQGPKNHFRKRLRTTLRSMGDMFSYLPVLIKKKKWITIWVLFSHRIFRWFTGFFMGLLLLINLILIKFGMLYSVLFCLQFLFYFFVILGYYGETKNKQLFVYKIGKIVYSFLLANLASSCAIIKLLTGKRIFAWKNY